MPSKKVEKIVASLEDTLGKLTGEETAQLAAQILNEIDPSQEHLEAFFGELDDNHHTELINRACDEDERE